MKPIIGITMGDPAGIGAEIIVKALNRRKIYKHARFLVIGSGIVLKDAVTFTNSKNIINTIKKISQVKEKRGVINLIDLNNISLSDFSYGEVNEKAGKASVEYIFKSIDLAMKGKINAVVTGPINKESIMKAGFSYTGHTEIFAEKTETKQYAMMLSNMDMKVVHVSTHVSLKDAIKTVKCERILTVIKLTNNALKKMGIKTPSIGVAGLNPHAGENGLFGKEEIDEIIPAIQKAKKNGIIVQGPIPSDTLFSKIRDGQYDAAVVMYHDQGHIPIKLTGFTYDKKRNRWTSVSGVNVTLGLPIVRTSVDHGTAYGKAGKGTANEGSLVDAMEMAALLTR